MRGDHAGKLDERRLAAGDDRLGGLGMALDAAGAHHFSAASLEK
jgi:hypothetical protein